MLLAMSDATGPGHGTQGGQSSEDEAVRRFGWSDMFVHPDEDPREEGGQPVGERAVLVMYLRNQRLTLEVKCAGLDAAAMARRSVEPSNLSLLGLVRHMAGVERYWFRQVMAGQGPRHYRPDDDPAGQARQYVAGLDIRALPGE